MSNGTLPVVFCDDESGCDEWELDYHEMNVSTVNGVRVTPVPIGWTKTPDGEHLCPRHSSELVAVRNHEQREVSDGLARAG